MDRVIGRIQVEYDLPGPPCDALQEQGDEQLLHPRRVVADPAIFGRLGPAQLKPVQCRLAGQRCTIAALSFELADQCRHHRIVAQLVVVVQILIAKRDPEDPLANQRAHLMLNQVLTAMIGEAAGKTAQQPNRPIGRSQKQRARVTRHRSPVERGHH